MGFYRPEQALAYNLQVEADDLRRKLEAIEEALKKRGLFVFEHVDGTVSINDR